MLGARHRAQSYLEALDAFHAETRDENLKPVGLLRQFASEGRGFVPARIRSAHLEGADQYASRSGSLTRTILRADASAYSSGACAMPLRLSASAIRRGRTCSRRNFGVAIALGAPQFTATGGQPSTGSETNCAHTRHSAWTTYRARQDPMPENSASSRIRGRAKRRTSKLPSAAALMATRRVPRRYFPTSCT